MIEIKSNIETVITSRELQNECNRIIKFFKLRKWYYFNEMPTYIFERLYFEIAELNSSRFIIDEEELKFMKLF